MKPYKLALAIPTMHRAQILRENLLAMWDEITRFTIGIYIVDDSRDDETAEMLAAFQSEYPHIYYQRNLPPLGHDANCSKTMAWPEAEYIWYLGDANSIKPGGIAMLLALVAREALDFVAVNSDARNFSWPDRLYDDGNELLRDIGWHLTMTGVTVYRSDIQKVLATQVLVNSPNFPQTALIFEKFALQNCRLQWLNEQWVLGNPNKVSYWSHAVLDVFLRDWSITILRLPNSYSEANKAKAIRMHGDRSGLFSAMKFLKYRSRGVYSWAVFKRFYRYIRLNTGLPLGYLLLVALLPSRLLFFLKNKI